MNTRFSVVLPSTGTVEGERLASEVVATLRALESMLSRFDPRGQLAAVNRCAADGPVRVSEELWTVVEACRQHHRRTAGAFDIAQGARQPGHGMHLLEADPEERTLRFRQPGMQLDLGGIGKGIALDLLMKHLREQQVEQAFLSFGESSLSVIGCHPAGDCWPVGVEHLFEPGRVLHQFDLLDDAMSTSGNRPGEAHIVAPSNGQPVAGCRTVSVACASAADAEALSTALFVLPAEQRETVLGNYPGAKAVAFSYREHDGDWTVEKSWQHDPRST